MEWISEACAAKHGSMNKKPSDNSSWISTEGI